ncbi:ABC transporter ATP-binding protein [Litoreibacter roseus]|uniref:Polyamine-transporting ATPase n=1 Tax=Litoreibacter roseus TaxID=2601869 RepID=A0A6N6JE92_9RHOB|nr:ABC transporter ATP-binding protein [Litoreibacter roseus]GFE64445.1 polyamine-transporting ATPase [Litoreibacter roseus]
MIGLTNVEKYYGDYHALRGITANIPEGEFFSLLGPSGCGKTTLLRAIAGFEHLSGGSLTIDGQDMSRIAPHRRPTNMVFQSYAIFPHLSVAENVGFGLRKRKDINRDARQRMVDEALDMVGLSGYGSRRAHALSGGQRQRVALARALILKPKVLLLDEPLSALDKKMREQMQAELRRLQRQIGITFVLVTHDQEEALIMSDRIAVMFDGQIAQMDAPQTLYRRPSTRRVAEFIGVMNFLPAARVGDEMFDVAGLGKAFIDRSQVMNGAGTDCVAGLRPETLSILFDGSDVPDHSFEGTITDRAYYGDMTYYDVVITPGTAPVTISMKNRAGRPILEPNTKATVAWDPRSLIIFGA